MEHCGCAKSDPRAGTASQEELLDPCFANPHWCRRSPALLPSHLGTQLEPRKNRMLVQTVSDL